MSSESNSTAAGDGWILLRAGACDASGLEIPTVRTDVSTPSGPVRLSLGEDREARVLLPLSEGEVVGGLPSAPALRIAVSTYSLRGKPIRYLDLTCLSHDLESVFAEVVDEMIERVAAGERCVKAARSTIEDFRALLLRSASADVPTSTIAGLVGELLVLNRLLDRSAGAWRSWRGPAGDRHDFRGGNSSLEVKASLRAGCPEITVNGLEQMEAPSNGSLHLLHVILEPVAGGMLHIAGLGRSAIGKADEPDRVRALLTALDCPDVEATSWNHHAFRLESEAMYEVIEGFPRLVPSTLAGGAAPAGISDVTYKIDLSTAADFKRSPIRYAEVEEGLIRCL
ncbi:PD-(D/E)XK motif protein [Sinorhizobium fredii]|uniref:PD-(D/E)XK motif protein n=1 Tax=Rhizobium fredii TaxID=380 RepID=UPI0005604481|nr:PD-(D/E)XK motif protein [Sinorhizobium fredii]AWM23726.1 hypothetical protein AOX55_0000446 [Sinorhizobium fredii CCBAU 25509]